MTSPMMTSLAGVSAVQSLVRWTPFDQTSPQKTSYSPRHTNTDTSSNDFIHSVHL